MRDYTPIELDNSPFSLPKLPPKTYRRRGLTITVREGDVRVSSITAPNVDYTEETSTAMIELLTKEIKKALKSLHVGRARGYLVVGLGNAGMTADALGSAVTKRIDVTPPAVKHGRLVYAFAPSVSGLTGIDSNDAVLGMVGVIEPDVVMLVDTLATADVDKLARVVQIKNTGLVPGGGVGADKPALDKSYLGVPVLSIGVPLVIYLRHVVASFIEDVPAQRKMDDSLYHLVVTPKEIDYTVDYFATIIATAINRALHP